MGEKNLEGVHHDLGQQVDFWSWISLSKRPIDVNAGEAPCSMGSLEMLQYPGSCQTFCGEGILNDDDEISAWLEKVCWRIIGWTDGG